MSSALAQPQDSGPELFQFWDHNIPDPVLKLVKSVESVNPGRPYRLFNDEGAGAFIRELCGSDTYAVYQQCAIPAMRSDLFRYCYLYACGGFYVDADYEAIQSIDSMIENAHSGSLLLRSRGLANGMMFARRSQDPLMAAVLEAALANLTARESNSVWSVTGPAVLQGLYANERSRPLFDNYDLIEESRFNEYFFSVPCLDYKAEDTHWLVAREKGLNIYKD